MENDPKVEPVAPERAAYRDLFEDLDDQVDAAGNRSLAQVLKKHPFPIYEAIVRRHRMLNDRRTHVGEFAVKVAGAAGEVLVGGFDLVWDVATAPVHLTLFPEIRHTIYKATLARFASEAGRETRISGTQRDIGDVEKIPYTTDMTNPPRSEAEPRPVVEAPSGPTEIIPPTPTDGLPPEVPVPPGILTPTIEADAAENHDAPKVSEVKQEGNTAEQITPPLVPEHQEHSPQREAFHRLMRDIFEVTEPALRADVRDRVETTVALGERTAQAWQDFTKTPWNIPRHVRQFDTALRGRDLGSIKMRLSRILLYNTVRAITAGVDIIDDIAEVPLRGYPGVGGYISAAVEFLSDEIIRVGTDWTIQQATQTRQTRFSSPIAVTASRINNIVPIFGPATNAPGLESRLRNAYSLPIAGVPIEYLYTEVNRLLTRIERSPRGQWMERFVFAVLGGTRREEAFRQERERTNATQISQIPPATS